ncbi:MAG: hypothetical protein GDYSWBUE_000338, partial [Candidatus Fervidibacterota bacterium]
MKQWNKVVVLLIWAVAYGIASADIKLPSLFSDHMVLQRGTNVAVWGTASPNEHLNIRLSLQGSST